MSVLDINDLVIHFQTDGGLVQAIDHLNLSVREGEIVGLVGESGCGKTTVARCILGVLPQPPAQIDTGAICFQGQDLLRAREADLTARVRGKAITFIPQDPQTSLNPLFPVGVQLRDMLAWSAPKRRRKRELLAQIVTLLQQVQIPSPEAQLKKYPHEFSGGQRQRLVIAAALAPQPELIIADEPTSALDVTVQAQILLLLKTLVRERGASVLLITHDLGVGSQAMRPRRGDVCRAGSRSGADGVALRPHLAPVHAKTARQSAGPARRRYSWHSRYGAPPRRSAPGLPFSYPLRPGHAGVQSDAATSPRDLSGPLGSVPPFSGSGRSWMRYLKPKS
jgi:ABC-type microcin C transport system duplicated ATPase subunit YejF